MSLPDRNDPESTRFLRIGRYWLPPMFNSPGPPEILPEDVSEFNSGAAHWAARGRDCIGIPGICDGCVLCSNVGDKVDKETTFAAYAILRGYAITRPGLGLKGLNNLLSPVEKVED